MLNNVIQNKETRRSMVMASTRETLTDVLVLCVMEQRGVMEASECVERIICKVLPHFEDEMTKVLEEGKPG